MYIKCRFVYIAFAMKTRLLHLLFITSIFELFVACQRSISPEAEIPSAGFLQKDSNNNCQPIAIAGNYTTGQNLTDSNYLEAEVNVLIPGTYTITTDTVNGYFFKSVGIFSNSGITQVKLFGTGNPLGAGSDNFIVMYNASACNVIVAVTINSNQPAVFTFD